MKKLMLITALMFVPAAMAAETAVDTAAETLVIFDLEVYENGQLISTPRVAVADPGAEGRSETATVRVGTAAGDVSEIGLQVVRSMEDSFEVSISGAYGTKADLRVIRSASYQVGWKEPLLFSIRRSTASPEMAVRVIAFRDSRDALSR